MGVTGQALLPLWDPGVGSSATPITYTSGPVSPFSRV